MDCCVGGNCEGRREVRVKRHGGREGDWGKSMGDGKEGRGEMGKEGNVRSGRWCRGCQLDVVRGACGQVATTCRWGRGKGGEE